MEAIPSTLTVEQRAKWITENAKDTLDHTEEIDLDEETVKDLEHKSSMASRRIDELKAVLKEFTNYIQKGTPVDHDTEVEIGEEPKRQPISMTIPPSKGIKELTKNREFADQQLRDGVRKEVTKIYLIPVPEDERLVAVDIEGNEFEQYSRPMTDVEKGKQGYMFKNNDQETVTQYPDRSEEGKKKKSKKKKVAEEVEAPEPEVQENDEPFV